MRKKGEKTSQDYKRGKAQANANEPQGYDLMKKSENKMKNLYNQELKANKELLDSKDLKLFKETEVIPIKNKLGASYDPAIAKFDNVLMKVDKNYPMAIRRNNPLTGKPYTAKEIDDIAYDEAGRRLNSLFKTLEGGGNPARRIIKEYPEVTALYRKSGRQIPSVQPRPEYLKDYIAGKRSGSLKDGGFVEIDRMLAEL